MAVTTWTFNGGYEGWTFALGPASTAGSTATSIHVTGAIRITVSIPVSPPATRNTQGDLTSDDLNATIANGDTIELDYGAVTGTNNRTSVRVRATYTDDTIEDIVVVEVPGPATLTLTLTQNKILKTILVRSGVEDSGGARTETVDFNEVRLTTVTALTATPGKLRTPKAFIDETSAGGGGGGGGLPGGDGGGSGGNQASISANGLNVYIALFNNLGFPTLIKIATTLTSDGTIVFNPGAGGRIGVQAGKQNADHLWIAGQFDSTNTVEKSENNGDSFTVKDDTTFGAIRTFEIGPNDDTRVLVFDGDNGDIIETIDDGTNWTTINATVTPLVNSLARFSQNSEEIVAANQGAASNSINYSPNTGINLEDYQTGVYPNADATKTLVNP